jgi:hypothetical protein
MRFQIAFLRSAATPTGEALDAAIAAALEGLEQRVEEGEAYVRLPRGDWVAFWREADADWFFVLSPVTAADGLAELVLAVAQRTASLFTIDFDDYLYQLEGAQVPEPLIDVGDMPLNLAPGAAALEDILVGCMAQFAALEANEAELIREGRSLPVFEELTLAQRDGIQPLLDEDRAAANSTDPIVEGPPAPGLFQKLSDVLFGKKV